MTKKEAAMLLELITLSYPNAYRGMNDDWKIATINMWVSSFPDVPYPIIQQAFNHYRMTNKFPPTVAEMVEELGHIYYQALELANIQANLGNERELNHFRAIMSCTHRYKDPDSLGTLQVMPTGLEGGNYGEVGQAYPGLYSGS